MTNLVQSRAQFQAHPFHLVEQSPWPIVASFSLLTLTISGVMAMNGYLLGGYLSIIGLISVIGTMVFWFRDIIAEKTYEGSHTFAVQKGLTIGVALFVISEVFFFLSIFWAFFHSSLAPTVELGGHWPPKGIEAINAFELPLLNTVLLLSSGSTATYAHHSLIQGNRKGTINGLIFTIILALIFTALQGFEYYTAPFTISDGAFGSTFYFATGFHGLHVIIGTLFLATMFWRIISYQLTDHHHVGFESALIYWHFVDVVWLFLYCAVYWWGS